MSGSGRVAFYGTLRRGELGHRRLGLALKLRFLGMCRIPGVLYDLGEYPALLRGDGIVVVELFELPDERILKVLDGFEGYDPASPDSSLFVRQETRLADSDDVAWVYYFGAGDLLPGGAKRIKSGDWRRR